MDSKDQPEPEQEGDSNRAPLSDSGPQREVLLPNVMSSERLFSELPPVLETDEEVHMLLLLLSGVIVTTGARCRLRADRHHQQAAPVRSLSRRLRRSRHHQHHRNLTTYQQARWRTRPSDLRRHLLLERRGLWTGRRKPTQPRLRLMRNGGERRRNSRTRRHGVRRRSTTRHRSSVRTPDGSWKKLTARRWRRSGSAFGACASSESSARQQRGSLRVRDRSRSARSMWRGPLRVAFGGVCPILLSVRWSTK